MERIKCQNCGLVDWEPDQRCRRCGSLLTNRSNEEARPESSSSAVKNLAFFLLFIAIISALAYKYWPTSLSPEMTASVSAKKSLNLPGEAIDVRQHLASGKNTIVYFYADW